MRVEASDNGAIPVMKDGGTVETGKVTGDAYPSKKTAAAESEATLMAANEVKSSHILKRHRRSIA